MEEKQRQGLYLTKLLGDLRFQERSDMCIRDANIWGVLLNETLTKNNQKSSDFCIRSMANDICRFLKPLYKKLGVKNTSELLVPEHGDVLLDKLMKMGGLQQFHTSPEAFIQGLDKKNVILPGDFY